LVRFLFFFLDLKSGEAALYEIAPAISYRLASLDDFIMRDFVAWLDSFSFSLTSKAAQPRCMKSRQRFH
jgi:hypothetical protein